MLSTYGINCLQSWISSRLIIPFPNVSSCANGFSHFYSPLFVFLLRSISFFFSSPFKFLHFSDFESVPDSNGFSCGEKKTKKTQGHLLAFIAKDNVKHSISVRYENHRPVLSPGAAHCARGEIKNKTPINKTEPGVRPWHISYAEGVLTGALGRV